MSLTIFERRAWQGRISSGQRMNRRMSCGPRAIRVPIVVFGLTVGSIAAGAPADDCAVELVGSERERWTAATTHLIEEMRLGGWARGCRSVSIDASEGRAELTFTALDGRVARRQLLDPVELLPTAQALSADGNVALPPASPAPEPASAPEARALVVEDSAPAASKAHREPSLSRPVFGGQTCVRLGANYLASPCIQLQALLPFGAFELGILGRHEFRYSNLSEPGASPDASSLGWGVVAGGRERVGKLAITAGLVGLLTGLRDGTGDDGGDEAEARVGAYAGVAWPAHSRIALRADGMFEWVPFSNGESRRSAEGAYSMPWWAVTSLVGVEVR